MTEKPNDKFIRFLKIYGPWTGSNNQFEEYVSDNASDLGIDPFCFTIPALQEYKDQIHELILNKQSQLVLICGHAGDGKTHMLHQIYLDEQLMGIGPDVWKEQLDNKELISSFNFKDIHFTVVKDLSTICSDTDLIKLAQPICKILNKDLPLLKSEYDNLQSNLYDDINQHNLPNIVLIAGNNGKILERFMSLNKLFTQDIIELNAIEMLEEYMIHHSVFNHCHIKCFDLSICLDETVVEEIYNAIYDHKCWQLCEQCSRYDQCPIIINRSLLKQEQVKERVKAMYHLLSDNGTHFTVRNILVELIHALLGNKASNVTTRFFTCQKVFNATKDGSQKLLDITSMPFDNLLGLNITGSSSKKLDDIAPIFQQLEQLKIGKHSNRIIDRFIMFGHQSNIPAIHEAYERFVNVKGFELPLKKIQENLHALTHEEHSESKTATIMDNMHEPMQSIRTMLFFTMPQEQRFQNINSKEIAGLFNPFLLTAFKYGQEYLYLKELVLSAQSLVGEKIAQSLIVGLNRAFTSLMIIDGEDELIVTTNNTFNDQMLCVVDDKNRFILKCDFAQVRSEQVLKIVPSPLVDDHQGLMCLAFYGKAIKNQKSQEQEKQDLVNKIVQLAIEQSDDFNNNLSQDERKQNNDELIALTEQWQVLSNSERKPHFNKIHKLAVKRKCDVNELVKAYSDYGSDAELVCYLKLTPKIFEYLMSLSSGKMSISFSQECQQAIANFKDNLLSYLSRTRSHSLLPMTKENKNLNNIKEDLEINLSIGHRAYCNNIINGHKKSKLSEEQVRAINQRINNIVFLTASESH